MSQDEFKQNWDKVQDYAKNRGKPPRVQDGIEYDEEEFSGKPYIPDANSTVLFHRPHHGHHGF